MDNRDGRLHLRDRHLVGEDLSGLRLDYLTSTNSTFVGCAFRNLTVRDASLGIGGQPSRFESCVFDGSKLKMGTAGQATFVGCSFRDVRISDWECRVVEMVDCTFSGTLRNCSFSARPPEDYRTLLGLERNEIRGNDFRDAKLQNVYFAGGVDLVAQRLPGGADYFYLPDAPAALDAVRHELAGWPEPARETAGRFLHTFERQVASGQRQIFGRCADYTRGYDGVGLAILGWWRKSGQAVEPAGQREP
jgi:hypothetical protein